MRVNALIDLYKDTLMNEKTRKILTVERIVEILGTVEMIFDKKKEHPFRKWKTYL
jgi:hypothetical protein